jgi:hypothetical protein
MAARLWRVEFDRAAAREPRKLGADAERRVLRTLRQRIAASADPRRFRPRADRRPQGALALPRRRFAHRRPPSRTTASWCWW